MSTRTLRWGLLGTSRINRVIIPHVRASARSRLAAVASRTIERAEAYAREWNIPRAFGSYQAMLADPDIDVIYNSLPNALHAAWTIAAAQAGKHILCEKPFAMTVEEVDAVIAAAGRAGVVVAEAFMYRHHPQTIKVQELVASGAIGKLRLVHGSHTFNIVAREPDPRLDPALGNGSIWDVGCYPINYARFVIGAEPAEAFGWQAPGSTGVNETFVGQLRFPGDIYAQFDCGFRAPFRAQFEVVGSEGTIGMTHPFKPGLDERIVLARGSDTQTIAIPGQDPYVGEVEDMADAILLGTAPRVGLADSRGNVAAIVALLRSAREGRPVPVYP